MTPQQEKWMDEHPNWEVVTPKVHHRDYARAANGRGKWKHDRVLCGDGSLLPGDSFCVGDRIYVRPPAENKSV
jgi:hypothetical protein